MKAGSLLVAGLSLSMSLSACNSSAPAPAQVNNGTGGAAGATPTTGAGGGVGVADETLCGNVTLAVAKTVPAGKTLAICAGTTVTASGSDVSLTVQGTLLVQGTAQSPVKLVGAQGGTDDWGGVIIDAGGTVTATYVELHNASIALAARPGSAFAIDHIVIDTSDAMMILSSNGSIAHGTMRGLGNDQSSTPIFVSNASPHITDTAVTGGYFGVVDMIVVGGPAAAPVFDRVEVADSHCAFHFDTGNGATISNSNVHHNAYGLMVIESVAGYIVHNNFEDNQINIGSCYGGAGVPSEVKDNYFVGAAFDDSCTQLTVTGAAPPAPYATGVGPTP
jgi:hypothetical protein